MMKRIAILFMLVCMSNGWLLANHWTPDDSQFEDNMTLTGVIQINGIEQQSANYEVGAFCGEVCRGSVMPMYFPPTQRYLVQLIIFGEIGDQITFKIFNHETDQELDLESPEMTFAGDGYGSPAEPHVLNFIGATASESFWVVDDSQFEDNMTLTGVIVINGVEQESDNLEVGVFCGEQCRGSQRASLFSPTHRYIVQLTIFGVTGDQLTFKIYDHTTEQILDLVSLESVTFNSDGYGSLSSPYELNFTGTEPQIQPTGVVITLNPGWNWISYLLETETPIKEALVNLTPADGDIIKSPDNFSNYNASTGQWNGSLTTLTPGLGYIYLRKGERTTFTYPK